MIEYIPWYQPGAPLVQCSECAAVVVSGNAEAHTEWHRRLEELVEVLSETFDNYADVMVKAGIAKKV